MKRILHVFGKLDRGGAETMIMNLYRNIDRNQVQFDFVVHSDTVGDYEPEILQYGGNIFRIPRYRGYNHREYVKSWKRLFEKHPEFKIIHGHVRSTAAIYLGIANRYDRITISHSHSTTSGKGFSANIKNLFQLPIRYIADYLLAPSEDAAIWLYGREVIHKDNFLIIKNAIDSKKFIYDKFKRKDLRINMNINDRLVIGHVGRFHQVKNHSFLLDVFKEVLALEPESILILIGDGELFSDIKAKARDLGIDEYVYFLGKKDDVYNYYQAMDIFVFPSFYEGLGLSVVEAQASGLPCIVSTGIPIEAEISNMVKTLSLDDEASKWAKEILAHRSYIRENMYEVMLEEKYDVKENAIFIQRFYNDIYYKT